MKPATTVKKKVHAAKPLDLETEILKLEAEIASLRGQASDRQVSLITDLENKLASYYDVWLADAE
ncbi:hypothetical protein QNH10_06410 [Sporosarcina thermotolerans]|uniref:hypothetical protein n=1 Tax=Sporosarcina thermotolerans TaxID=633404 RepID=UPI0024BCC18A|nr:hypothetical protein [Sporosarcina thermotolerans]WHT50008.1 hypothetical protein QNH10_06410 [Sporosarcina thermotolerans]